VAKIIKGFLDKTGGTLENVHLLGHSLGAHISGNAGRYLNGSLGRITGLDPAGPLFPEKASDALKPNDALFVDAIHSDQLLGSTIPRAMVDFYPNRGLVRQPGCSPITMVTEFCISFPNLKCMFFAIIIWYIFSSGL
jgi:phosphatidic acid-selective phospholipase A1